MDTATRLQHLRIQAAALQRNNGMTAADVLRDAKGHFQGRIGTGINHELVLERHEANRTSYVAKHNEAAWQKRLDTLTSKAAQAAHTLTKEDAQLLHAERRRLLSSIKQPGKTAARAQREYAAISRHLERMPRDQHVPLAEEMAQHHQDVQAFKSRVFLAVNSPLVYFDKESGAFRERSATANATSKGRIPDWNARALYLMSPDRIQALARAWAQIPQNAAAVYEQHFAIQKQQVKDPHYALSDAEKTEIARWKSGAKGPPLAPKAPKNEPLEQQEQRLREYAHVLRMWYEGPGRYHPHAIDMLSQAEREAGQVRKAWWKEHVQHNQLLADAQHIGVQMGAKVQQVDIAPIKGAWAHIDIGRHAMTVDPSYFLLPESLKEFVIAHEVAHLLAPKAGHGPLFQAFLSTRIPDWQARDTALQALDASKGLDGAKSAKAPAAVSTKPRTAGKGKTAALAVSAHGPAPHDLTPVPVFSAQAQAEIAATWQRLPDLNPDGASHEFYKATANGQAYFFKPSTTHDVAAAHYLASEAARLGLSDYLAPSLSYTDAQGRIYYVLPWITGPRMDELSPAQARAVIAALGPVTQAKLGFFGYALGLADIGANNVMLVDGKPVMVDLDSLVLSGFSDTPVMLNAYFGNSSGKDGKAVVGGSMDALLARVARMPIPAETMDWMRSHILAHQDAMLRHLDTVARTGLDMTQRHEAAEYTRIMANGLVRMAYLRQLAATAHPTWGTLSAMAWGPSDRKINDIVHQMSYLEDHTFWDTPAHTPQEVTDLLRQNGITITATGVSFQRPKEWDE